MSAASIIPATLKGKIALGVFAPSTRAETLRRVENGLQVLTFKEKFGAAANATGFTGLR